MTRQGGGGVALGITMMAAFFGAAFGIVEMIFFAPLLVSIAFRFGPAEICTLKGIAMTLLGLLLGTVGTDVDTGAARFTFGAAVALTTGSTWWRWRSASSASPSSSGA